MMTTRRRKLASALLFLHAAATACVFATSMPDMNFNENWRFHLGAVEDGQSPNLDDSAWRQLDLPHDWAIEGPFSPEYLARTGGLPVHGTGWYRKSFDVPATWAGSRIAVEFDGAMANAQVWVNGQRVGHRPYGYISFECDITDAIRFGEANIIAVRLTPEDLAMRWYPGAGLYRSVRLKVDDPLHIATNGTFVTTPLATANEAVVHVATTIRNDHPAPRRGRLQTTLFDENGVEVASDTHEFEAAGNDAATLEQLFHLENPVLWQVGEGHLYKAVSRVLVDDEETDLYETTFGIRSIRIDPDRGVFVNGRHIRINGVCMHHDLGPLGAAVNYRATERQIEIMQSMGANSVRTSHNPPSRELLEVCDRLGVLVIVEAFDEWRIGKVPNGYHKYFDEWHETDLRDMVRRDRNHPSVYMWSIGNEILEQGDKDGWRVAKRLSEICREEDPTRPTTVGFNYYPAPFENKLAYFVDVVGMNYWPLEYGEIKARHPDMIIYGSETSSQTSSRGVYRLPWSPDLDRTGANHVSSYDVFAGPPWAYPPDAEFQALEANPFVLGEYVWTGFDYLGEPTPFQGRDHDNEGWEKNADWPSRSSYFGTVDLAGFPKDRYYLYQSQWTSDPMVHLLPHWNWEGHEGETIPVVAYTNCQEVELFLNGRSLGRRVKGVDTTTFITDYHSFPRGPFESKYRLSWQVPYEPGSLKVVARNDGAIVAEKEIVTAGAPARLELTADRSAIRADGTDLSFVTVRVLDAKGNFCPKADNLVKFTVEGEGALAAVENGDPNATTSYQAQERAAFSGMCLAILRSSRTAGTITLTASAEGMPETRVTITTTASPRP